MYFREHFSYPHGLPVSEHKVSKRQSVLASTCVIKEEASSVTSSLDTGLLPSAHTLSHHPGRRFPLWIPCPLPQGLLPSRAAGSLLGSYFALLLFGKCLANGIFFLVAQD